MRENFDSHWKDALFAEPYIPPQEEIAVNSTAKEVCKRLERVFYSFMAELNPDEELGLALTSFGAIRQIRVESVKALGPNLLQIDGYEADQPVVLVQHISQLSFLLVPLKLASPEQEPLRKIGFSAE